MLTDDDRLALTQQLIANEGIRLKPYADTAGQLTIGIGHNLTARGLTMTQVLALLADDIAETTAEVVKALPWTADLDGPRFRVVIDLAFNTGLHGLLEFNRMLAALHRHDYQTAAAEIVNSKIAPARAQRLAALMTS